MNVIYTCAFFIAMATTIAVVFSQRGDCLACHESASASGGMFVHVEGTVLLLACCSSRVPHNRRAETGRHTVLLSHFVAVICPLGPRYTSLIPRLFRALRRKGLGTRLEVHRVLLIL